jgi:minor extracellular protease Epr
MKASVWTVFLIGTCLLGVASVLAGEDKSATEAYLDRLHSQGKERVIVRFKDDAQVDAALVEKHGGKLIRKFSTIKSLVCEMPQVSLDSLRNEASVLRAYPDAIVRAEMGWREPADTEPGKGNTTDAYTGPVTNRWNNLAAGVNSIAAWDRYNLDGTGVKIAFIDTGVNYALTNLGSGIGPGFKCLGGYDFVDDDEDPINPTVDETHGTAVVSVGVGQGVLGGKVVGVAYNANFYALRAIGSTGTGFITDVMGGIEWASTEPHKADVISMSLGAYDEDHVGDPFWPYQKQEYEAVCNDAYNAGVVLVAASGNRGYDHSGYPAAFASVISVGGHAEDQTLYNYNSSSSCGGVDIVAPGARVYSVYPDNSAWWIWGTSMATPHAAGLLALQIQYARQNHIQVNNDYLWEVMKHSAKDMPLITNAIYKGNGKIWAAETNPPPPTPADGSIDAMAERWPLNWTITYSNYLYLEQGLYPAYAIGAEMSQHLTLSNNTATAGNYPDAITNLDITTTQAYYQHDTETNLPGAAVEAFARILSLATNDITSVADTYAIPTNMVPGLNRTAVDLQFKFVSDGNNRLIQVTYPYAGLWSVPLERPVLSIASTGSNSVLLVWPTQAVSFALQTTGDLGATNWAAMTSTPGIAGTNYVVEVQPLASPAFFRLAR